LNRHALSRAARRHCLHRDRLARPLAGPVSAAAARLSAEARSCAGKTANSAIKAIKKTWGLLLNGTGPATLDQKAAVIQGTNDPAFRQVLRRDRGGERRPAQDHHRARGYGEVHREDDGDRRVHARVGGQAHPGLAPSGNAVLNAGAWKATKSTICDLFALSSPALTQSGPCAA